MKAKFNYNTDSLSAECIEIYVSKWFYTSAKIFLFFHFQLFVFCSLLDPLCLCAGGLKAYLFLTVLEVGILGVNQLNSWWEPSCRRPLCSHMAERVGVGVGGEKGGRQRKLRSFIIRALIPSHHEDPTFKTSSKPNDLPKAPSPNTITLGVGASTWILGGHKHQVYKAKGKGCANLSHFRFLPLTPSAGLALRVISNCLI